MKPKPFNVFFYWPERKDLVYMFGRCFVFFMLFYGVFGCANFLASMHNYRIVGEFKFENYIPFVPLFSLVYFSGTFFLLLSPFLLRKEDQFIPFFKLLVLELFIAAIFFILLPIEIIDHVNIPEDTILGSIFNFNDKANLDYNYFPSLHVTFAFTLSFLVSEKKNVKLKIICLLWACSIAMSTLLTKQHYFVDVVGGIILAILVYKFKRFRI